MPEPFKNMLNKQVIRGMARHFRRHWSEFNERGFVSVATRKLEDLELKQRTDRVTETMTRYLPGDFTHAAEILLNSLATKLKDDLSVATTDDNGIAGWAIMPMAQYVGQQGQTHFELSMRLFREMTKRASSEFGIRWFLITSPARTLNKLSSWINDPDPHVRRLVSEGTRPRLPWAMRLPEFIEDPKPVLTLLERLKDDKHEYVRRSVANSLNDIAKDHPDLVADIARQWLSDASDARRRLVRHACRTLLKQGNKIVLDSFGYKKPVLERIKLRVHSSEIVFGETLEFDMTIEAGKKLVQPLMIDYVIHHVKANGSTSPKVFKWKDISLQAHETVGFRRRHALKPITTRVYHPGVHELEILVNGVSYAKKKFTLLMKQG